MIKAFKLALLTTLITISGFASAEIDAGLLESAEQGHASAQNSLGVAYAFGNGVPGDTVIAYAWANLAGANGEDVTEFKEFLEQRMSPEDKSEAQKLTR